MFNGLKVATLTAVAMMAGSVSIAGAADVTLKLGHLANEQDVWHKASLKFAEEVAALTNKRVEVKVFPNETLGKEMDLVNGMQLGTVDMTITGESLQNWAPKAALLAIPYAYKSLEQMIAVANGPIGKDIEAQIIDKAKIRPVAFFPRGARNLTSNRPIKSLDDLKGLKMRVPNVPLFVNVWRGLGAQPTPMAFSEVFTSLQNGVLEAQENPLALIKSANFFEVQKYLNKTEHVRSWIYLAIGEKSFNKLSDADKKAVLEAGRRAQAHEHALFNEDEKKLEAELKAKGMTFVDVDTASFAAKAKDAVLASVKPEIKATVESIFAMK
jgi:tripartite ATP-independent transporter DctP family solute receptor